MRYGLVFKKFWITWLFASVFFVSAAFLFRIKIGEQIWQTLRLPQPALFFNSKADFAVEIGNYYFNVYKDGTYDLDSAEKYYKKALKLDSNVSDAWHQLARINFLRGNFNAALSQINKQIEIHGSSFMASYYIRGLINGFLGNFKQAENDFKFFLIWDNKNWAAHNDLAWIYFKEGDYKKVEEIARSGLEWNKNNPWLLTSLGVALINLNKKYEARAILNKALSEAKNLTAQDWQNAYPGNNPLVADKALAGMIKTIGFDLSLTGNNE